MIYMCICPDRSGSDFLAVRGDRVKTMYTLSDYSDNAHFNVPDDTLISYTEGTHIIPHISGFGEMSVSEKIKAYDKFFAHQVCHHDTIVDSNGHYLEDRGIYHSNSPFGPFTCTVCGASYDELPSMR